MVEGARLESVYTATYRGFEPLSLRQVTVYIDSFKFITPQVTWLSGVFIVHRSVSRCIDNHLRLGVQIRGTFTNHHRDTPNAV